MRHLLRLLCLLLPFSSLKAHSGPPDDQALVLFGSCGYVLYRVLDFANDYGFRYIKVLSYEFTGFEHSLSGTAATQSQGGRYFELKDDCAKILFLCYDEKPDDPYIVDLEKYRSLLETIYAQNE